MSDLNLIFWHRKRNWKTKAVVLLMNLTLYHQTTYQGTCHLCHINQSQRKSVTLPGTIPYFWWETLTRFKTQNNNEGNQKKTARMRTLSKEQMSQREVSVIIESLGMIVSVLSRWMNICQRMIFLPRKYLSVIALGATLTGENPLA